MDKKIYEEKIQWYKDKLLEHTLQENGTYVPRHILNTKSEFNKTIKENLRNQRKYGSQREIFQTSGKIQEILVQNFNYACSYLIKQLNGYNLGSVKEKISDKANEMIQICDSYDIIIKSHHYFNLKIEQAELENDYILFQAEEKYKKQEQARRIKEQKQADQEWIDRLMKLETELKSSVFGIDDNSKQLQEKIAEARKMLRERKAGWVYIISNPDMKDGMCKIGVSRRENPVKRVDELSNASHAFRFKIHAIIYSEDCFGLETSLHKRFAKLRVNKDNFHKEFFYVTPYEIQKVLKDEYGIDVEMNDDIYSDDEKLTEFYNFNFDD